jgi:cytochrome P450
MSDDTAPEEDDPLASPEALAHPQPLYKMMRDMAPVVEVERNMAHTTIVSQHDDVMTVLRTPEVFSSNSEAVDIGQIRPLIPLQIDPPDHAKYRKLLDPLFAPKRVAELEDATRDLARGLITDATAGRSGCNFHDAVAEPFPSTVFLQLLGLPISRTSEFIELKDGIIRPDATDADERSAMMTETGKRIYAVLEEVVDERLAEPAGDFISGFLASEVDGERLTRNDVVDIGYLFFLAGLDTVTASLDCFLGYLAQNPDKRQMLVDEPSIMPAAIEELLRWETPVTGVARIAVQDTELNGCPIQKGDFVAPILGSANTDERVWADADTVDFHRAANKHHAFGGGVHRCLGSHLARMELRVALEEWHAQIPEYRLADGTELLYTEGLRQVENLELVW